MKSILYVLSIALVFTNDAVAQDISNGQVKIF
jgi:hypothetical protein